MFHHVSKTGGDLAVLSMTGSFPCLKYLCVSERRLAGVIPQQIEKVALFQIVFLAQENHTDVFQVGFNQLNNHFNWIDSFCI